MSVVLLEVKIENNYEKQKYNVRGIINKKTNTLTYNDGKSKNKYYYDENVLERENDKIKMNLMFKANEETNSMFYDKKKNIKIYLKISTTKIEIVNHNIYIEYTLEKENGFKYKIEVLKIIKK